MMEDGEEKQKQFVAIDVFSELHTGMMEDGKEDQKQFVATGVILNCTLAWEMIEKRSKNWQDNY